MTTPRALALTVATLGALACQRSESRTAADSLADTSGVAAADTMPTAGVPDTIASPPASTSTDTPPRNTPPPNRPPAPDPLSIPLPDTARGIVRLVGSTPMTTLILARNDVAGETLSLTGPSQALLRNVVGVEVAIVGRQTSDRDVLASPRGAWTFIVDSFYVRAADGTAAHDGVLEQVNGQYRLRLADGTTRPIGTLPDALREHVGSRIYIVGSPDRPSAWGIIRPR